jgi:CheY-like chemotaxis protein
MYARVDICDCGDGMAPEILNQVLEPFFTTKEPGKGTGLGLSMVDGFARQSKGCVRVVSERGRGTTVSLVLPLAEGQAGAAEEVDSSERPGLRPGNGEVILLVEDEPALRAFASRVLEGHGYRVLQAADAREAVALMDGGIALDLLFSDIMLPGGILGPELAQKFHARYPDKGILLTSGYAEPGILPAGMPAEVLKKPYGRDALLQAVQGQLQTG